jgi:hypothetical protein
MPKSPQPTWIDHHELNFWLWACLKDGEAYLQSSRDLFSFPRLAVPQRIALQRNLELEKYHFVTALGKLLRVLKRAQHLFPVIQPAYSRANHLINEGKLLRDMIEHSDDYQKGGGYHPDKFVHEATNVATNLPGDKPGTADATSTIIDENGHWLGGRFNVERAVIEIRLIQDEVNKIPAPVLDGRFPRVSGG